MNSDNCPMEVKGGATNKHGKVNILYATVLFHS